jgi:quercetin dioxygenase-like cupin family protein
LQFIKGEAQVVLGEEHQIAREGTWVRMPANLSHSIHAKQETLMLLTLIL